MAMGENSQRKLWNSFKMADFFLVRTASLFTLRTFGAQINWRVMSRKVLFAPHRFLSNKSPIHFAGASRNGNTFSMANGTFKMKMDIDRHGPRLMPNNCKNLNPPIFSLPTTFKVLSPLWKIQYWASKDIQPVVKRRIKKFRIHYLQIRVRHFLISSDPIPDFVEAQNVALYSKCVASTASSFFL